MTLVVAGMGKRSIWMLTDRRVSYSDGRPPKDDACKITRIEGRDGVALLGYAGLGETVGGTEPSEWMARIVRGRQQPLEQSLEDIAAAAKRELPRHLARLGSGPDHHIVIAALFQYIEPRLYLIAHSRRGFVFSRLTVTPHGKPSRICVGGSGTGAFSQLARKGLLTVLRAYDRGRITPPKVAAHLASINNEVSSQVESVGPRCIVSYCAQGDGGSHWMFTGSQLDPNTTTIPTIGNGMDMNVVVDVLARHTFPVLTRKIVEMRGMDPGAVPAPPEIDYDAMNAELATYPDTPDETLK